MLNPGEIHVWILEGPSATDALRIVLPRYTDAPLEFGRLEHGKPFLPAAPHLQFNLSHSHGRALVALALDVPVGADIERLRPMPDCLSVAERFVPSEQAAELAAVPADLREAEFFRLWTRTEAMLKARGIGLFGAGAALDGTWTVESIDAGPDYAAAVAAERAGMRIVRCPCGADSLDRGRPPSRPLE